MKYAHHAFASFSAGNRQRDSAAPLPLQKRRFSKDGYRAFAGRALSACNFSNGNSSSHDSEELYQVTTITTVNQKETL